MLILLTSSSNVGFEDTTFVKLGLVLDKKQKILNNVSYIRVSNMKNQLSQTGSMKVPVQCTYGGKLKTQIIAHITLLWKSCSS